MPLKNFSFAVVATTLAAGLIVSVGCQPRKKANTASVAAATSSAPVVASSTPTTSATPSATPSTVATPAPTFGTPATGIDPNVLADILNKAAGAIGVQVPSTGTAGNPGDPLEAAIKLNAAKFAPGFVPASPVGRAKLKTGEHAGMNADMEQGKCYMVFGAGGAGVTQLGLHVLFPAAPPNAVMASDTAHGAQPVLTEGKPLCPPLKSTVRVDTAPIAGGGDVAVQVWVK